MRSCPECGGAISYAKLIGPVVWAESRVTFKNNGDIDAVQYHVAKTKIDPITHALSSMQCPLCNYEGAVSAFVAVEICPFTGEVLTDETKVSCMFNGEQYFRSTRAKPSQVELLNFLVEWKLTHEGAGSGEDFA